MMSTSLLLIIWPLACFRPKYGPFNKDDKEKIPKIWLRLPYIGKYGETVARKCISRIKKLTSKPMKFILNWQTTKIDFFINTKDPTPTEYKSALVYKFVCPACNASYIGKTDRCLLTRIKEHSHGRTHSEIYNHTTQCDGFKYLKDMISLPDHLNSSEPPTDSDFVLANTSIVDQSRHWSDLLLKEALAIRRQRPILNHGLKATKELYLFS